MTYANIAATVAVVFAMCGGAYAASKYIITSTKQIKPSVIAQLKGKSGPAGPKGETGLAGANGKDGLNGSNGSNGSNGKEGPQGATGPQGAKGATGPQGSTGPQGATGAKGEAGVIHPGETLPSGASETGAWGLAYTVPAGEPVKRTAISFPIPLAKAAAASGENIIGVEEGEGESKEKKPFPAGCKGNVEKPQANKGNLCIFVGFAGGAGSLTLNAVLSPGNTAEVTGTTGAQLQFSTTAGFASSEGTWAVTAE